MDGDQDAGVGRDAVDRAVRALNLDLPAGATPLQCAHVLLGAAELAVIAEQFATMRAHSGDHPAASAALERAEAHAEQAARVGQQADVVLRLRTERLYRAFVRRGQQPDLDDPALEIAGNAVLVAALVQAYRVASEIALEAADEHEQLATAPDQALQAARASLAVVGEQLDELAG